MSEGGISASKVPIPSLGGTWANLFKPQGQRACTNVVLSRCVNHEEFGLEEARTALLTGRPGDLNFQSVYTGGVIVWHSMSTPAEPVPNAGSLSTLLELGFSAVCLSCGAGVWYMWEAYAG